MHFNFKMVPYTGFIESIYLAWEFWEVLSSTRIVLQDDVVFTNTFKVTIKIAAYYD